MFFIMRRTLLILSCVLLWTSCQQIASDDGDKIATREQIDGCLKKSKERLSLCGIPKQLDLPRCSFDSCYEAIEVVQDGKRERYFCSVADQNVQWLKINTTADCTDDTDLTILPIEVEKNQKSESAVQRTPVSERPADQQKPPADQQKPPAANDDDADDSDSKPDTNDSDDATDQSDSDDDDSADTDDAANETPDEADDSDDSDDSDDVVSDEEDDDSDDVVSDEDADDSDDDSDSSEEPAAGGGEEPAAGGGEEPAAGGGEEPAGGGEEPAGGEQPAGGGGQSGGSGSVIVDILDGIFGPFAQPTQP